MSEAELNPDKRTLLVCQNCSCLSRGSPELLKALAAADLPEDVDVREVGCLGQCNVAPNIRIVPEETWYCRLQPEDIDAIVEQHLKGGQPVQAKLHPRIHGRYYG